MIFPGVLGLVGFFDGASQNSANICGAGSILRPVDNCYFKVWMHCGHGMNTKRELLSLWILLRLCSHLGLDDIHVYEDSQIIVEWAQGIIQVHILSLNQWLIRVRKLINNFIKLDISHIYREQTSDADFLSKAALYAPSDVIFSEH